MELSPKHKLLRRYLDRYRHIINRIRLLKFELSDVETDFNTSPFHGAVNDGMSHGTSLPSIPTYIVKTAQLKEQIYERQVDAVEKRNEVVAIINMLPEITSDQKLIKDIIEAKYIGLQSEDSICYDIFHISQRTYYRKVDEGINYLISLPDVIRAVDRFAIEITMSKHRKK